jgi:hypothetical protein
LTYVTNHWDRRLVFRLDKVIPSDPTLLDNTVQDITAALDRTACWGDIEPDVKAIGLAVGEALANAIVHGNHCDLEKTVRIFVAVNEHGDLLVSVKDSGSGFDPSRLPNPIAEENLLAPVKKHVKQDSAMKLRGDGTDTTAGAEAKRLAWPKQRAQVLRTALAQFEMTGLRR